MDYIWGLLSLKQEKWQLKTYSPGPVSVLCEKLGISRIMAQALVGRGITTEEEAKRFLRSDLGDLHDPFLMEGMEKAAKRLALAITSKEEIAVWGDYDADGVTATALLMRVLQKLGASVRYHLPSRLQEGYGLNPSGIRKLAEAGVRLLITVDSGIAASEEVALANELGMDVIVTDHHEPQDKIPDAFSVLNPKLGTYPFRELAGVGVAFKLSQAVASLLGKGDLSEPSEAKLWCQEFLDIVALGTVADVVPLIDENRIIVKAGLSLLSESQNPGLAAMLQGAGLSAKPLSSYHLGFILGPRLNAVGRLGDAEQAVELLLTDDPNEAQALAKSLEEINRQRQAMCEELYNTVSKTVTEEKQEDAPVIVVGGEGWHPGVIGIVASRISESYKRPTILISWEGEEGRASGRSLPGFDLFAALTRCKEHLVRYGGHAQAAGLTIQRDKLAQLRQALCQLAAEDGFQLEEPVLELEGELLPSQLSFELLGELELLGPHGEQNPEPLFLASGLEVLNWSWVGEGAKHLRLNLRDHTGVSLGGIGFGMGDLAAKMEKYLQGNQRIDLAYKPRLEEWRGTRKISMQMDSVRLHRGPARETVKQPAIPILEQDGYTILDAREVVAKGEYIAALLSDGARPLLYCPSLEAAEAIRSQLQTLLPKLGERILLLDNPGNIERLARGDWSLAIWPLPLWTGELQQRIRFLEHLIFYLPPPDPLAFSTLSTLGEPAFIHLLFNSQDLTAASQVKEKIPDRDTLGRIYLLLKSLAQQVTALPTRDLVGRIQRGGNSVWKLKLSTSEVILGIEILSQLEIVKSQEGSLYFYPPAGKLNLEASPLYRLRESDEHQLQELVANWKLPRIGKLMAQGREAAS